MSDVKGWYTVANSNGAASPDGWQEGMDRSEVNDTGRETHASAKRWYDDPGFREPFEDYTFARVTNTRFSLADGSIESDASQLLQAGQRVRMIEGATTWEGYIASLPAAPSYSAPTTTFYVDWDTPNTTGPATLPTAVFVHDKELGQAAFKDVGTSTGELVLHESFADSAFIAQASLDVGELGDKTMAELSQDAWRYRLNMNGDLERWQRGTSFTAATSLTNDADNVCADGVTIISDGNDRLDVERSTDVPTGAGLKYSMRCIAASTATNKFGILIPIPRDDAADYAESGTANKVCGSFYAKLDSGATGIDALRAYIVQIKVETPTVTPISAWANGSTGTSPTMNTAEWDIVEAADVALTSSWQRFTPSDLTNVAVPSGGAGGLALMIVADETTFTTGAAFFLAGLQVNAGEAQLPFVKAPSAVEWARALQHCETTFPDGTQPAHNQGVANAIAAVSSGTNIAVDWRFAMPKWKAPTLVTYNPSDASPATGNFEDSASTDRAVSSNNISTRGVQLFCTTATDALVHHIAAYAHANVWGAN